MTSSLAEKTSTFIATFRLKPDHSFTGLQAHLTTSDGYDVQFRDDLVWLTFHATPGDWLQRLQTGTQALRTTLAVLAIQVEYSFDLEPLQWVEDKPRDRAGKASYVLGKLGPDLAVQKEAPVVKAEQIHKGEIHAHLASRSAYYRYALLDYSVALSFPRESIVFCARSMEWVERHFRRCEQGVR